MFFKRKAKYAYGIVMRGNNTNIFCGKAFTWKEAVERASKIKEQHFFSRVTVHPLKAAESLCQQTRLPF